MTRRAALLLAAAALSLGSCSAAFQGSVPQRDGTIDVPGLSAPVEIVRDRWGVPHISARDDRDLSFAQGFVHAQDRLFQMDTERRVARGELAEAFGPTALPADRLFRHLGFAARAPALYASWPKKTREIVSAYCDGVNAAMAAFPRWPAEFRIARYAPRRFTPEDVAAGSLLKSFGLAQWAEEAALYRMAQRIPREKLEEIAPRVQPDSPVVVSGAGAAAAAPTPDPALLAEGFASLSAVVGGIPRSGGSNAWAVSGRKSATGRPILASDPHLMLSCPSLWYEVHLTAPGVDVYGVSFPGAPGVVIGHNARIAWGMTNAMLDDADFFVERIDGDRAMFRKKWVPLVRREERIAVKGAKEERVTVLETPHGPILSPVLPGIAQALAFRWIGYDGGDPIGALHRLNRARDAGEFLDALSGFAHPAQNIVYADAAGNIGVAMAGRIPIRKGGRSLLPVPGDTGEWEWTGTVPFSGNPKVFNPPEGFVVAANFPPAGNAFPPYLSRLYEPSDRGKRIRALLGEDGKFTVERFERIQADVRRADAEPAAALALRVARKRMDESQALRDAARILEGWDRNAAADSAGQLLYAVFSEMLIENLYRDDLGPDLYDEFARSSRLAWNAVDRAIGSGDSLFLENAATGRKDSLEDAVARSLTGAMKFLDDRLGTARKTWSWGRLHQVGFDHPFAKNRFLKRWFAIGPFPVGGDGRTVFKQEYRHGTDFSVLVGPSMRQVVPLGVRSEARSVITTGQSGHFFEPHFRDQAPLWLAGRSHPAWTSPKEIEENAEARLTLSPKGRR